MVMESHPDFIRVQKEVEDLMKQLPEWQSTDAHMWETVYFQVRGRSYERLSAEDRARPPVVSAEPGQPGSIPGAAPTDLYKITQPQTSNNPEVVKSAGRVADKLGVTHDSYRKSMKELEGDGLLPMTVDTRRSK
jgi:hypothetical protein